MRLPGSLTIVGLGPARPGQVTREACELLNEPASPLRRAYGLRHARDLARAVAPALGVRSIDGLYALPGVDRPAAYEDLAHTLLRRAFEDGFEVLYLVAGSPLFYNDTVLRIREICAQRGLPLRLVHGMSFVELVLEGVQWSGRAGLQLLSAWNVARDGMALMPGVPALICQVGEHSRGGDALCERESVRILAELREALLRALPPEHEVVLLSSSGPPDYRNEARALPLRELADRPVPVYANLWVPAPAAAAEARP